MTGRDELAGIRLSRHARDVMRRRRVDPEDVADVLLEPDVTEPHGAARRYVRGPLAVVLATDPRPVVVTVLLRSGAAWTDADARGRVVA